ncbi:MAG: hypothetical protein A3G18_00475 [Rhodospirillales bacterium RIFCSPLOWO2_12_FULL_58_28]|nr:MAG: hypothetical protein A3H92_03080 [Rhodospirillales bacterium RIFCSPLOWO2_02_FULL_58_16]OHC79937.1 MAG: hypothetical protein A3G18_00475 [Rhodospirillales bacterium RIFCSPLOWO2_12_FULL_58_28]
MFKKNDDKESRDRLQSEESSGGISAPPLKPFSKKGSHQPAKQISGASFSHEIPNRPVDSPNPARRMERSRPGDMESKKLIVGREICLKGEITSCDKLVVEGRVEAALTNARIIEVAPSGFFKGNAQVKEADISGRFEGELTADDKLTVRNGGKISGIIRYGKIIIEAGGEIDGEMETLEKPAHGEDEGKAASGIRFKSPNINI